MNEDDKNGQHYLDIFHVHSAEFKLPSAPKGSLMCNIDKTAAACRYSYQNDFKSPSYVKCIDENDPSELKNVSFDYKLICPVL